MSRDRRNEKERRHESQGGIDDLLRQYEKLTIDAAKGEEAGEEDEYCWKSP